MLKLYKSIFISVEAANANKPTKLSQKMRMQVELIKGAMLGVDQPMNSFVDNSCIDNYFSVLSHFGILTTMESSTFQIGDLVFARCTKCKPWPAKIIQIYEKTTFKVDFYFHNSMGVVDLSDLQKVTFATIQKYTELYKEKKTKDEHLLIEGINAIQKDFKRRLEIENHEVEQWKDGKPTKAQQERLDSKLQQEIKRAVPKPSQNKLDQINRKLSKSKSKKKPSKSQNSIKIKQQQQQSKQSQVKIEVPETRTSQRKKNKLTVVLKPSGKVTEGQRQLSKEIRVQAERSIANDSEIKVEKGRKGKNSKKTKKIKKATNKLKKKQQHLKLQKQQVEDQKEAEETLLASAQPNPNLLSPPAPFKKELESSMSAEGEVSLTEQLNSNQPEGHPEIKYAHDEEHNQVLALQEEIVAPQQQLAQFEKKQEAIQAEQPSGYIPDISIHTSFAFNSTHSKLKVEEQSAMIEERSFVELHEAASEHKSAEVEINCTENDAKESPQADNEHPAIQDSMQPEVSNEDRLQDFTKVELPGYEGQEGDKQSELSLHSSEMKDVINQIDSYVSEPEESKGQPPEPLLADPESVAASPQQQDAPEVLGHAVGQEEHPQTEYSPIVEQNALNQEPEEQLQAPAVSLKPQSEPDYCVSELAIQQAIQLEQLVIQPEQQAKNQHIQNNNSPAAQTNLQAESSVCPEAMNPELNSANSGSSLQEEQSKMLSSLEPPKFNPLYLLMKFTGESKRLHERALMEEEKRINAIRQARINRQARQAAQKLSSEMKPEVKELPIDAPAQASQDEMDPLAFEKRYADYHLTKNDYCEMVRGLPRLKQQLKTANPKAMARYVVLCLQKLKELVTATAKKYSEHLLPMWKKQLFMGIIDSDILPTEVLIEEGCVDRMLIFISAFEKSNEAHRSECHVELMLTMNRLDLYIYRFRRDFVALSLSENQKLRQLQLFQLYEARALNLA